MYAVIQTGGKQYKVTQGETLKVEKLAGDVGATVEIKEVVAVGEGESIKIGTPNVDNASVVCEIIGHDKSKKVMLVKKRRRKGYTKKQGHRQPYTSIKVKEIRG